MFVFRRIRISTDLCCLSSWSFPLVSWNLPLVASSIPNCVALDVYEVVFGLHSLVMGSLAVNELDEYVLRWNSYRLKDFEKELVECKASFPI